MTCGKKENQHCYLPDRFKKAYDTELDSEKAQMAIIVEAPQPLWQDATHSAKTSIGQRSVHAGKDPPGQLDGVGVGGVGVGAGGVGVGIGVGTGGVGAGGVEAGQLRGVGP